jgi:error-prone DNA polymerase
LLATNGERYATTYEREILDLFTAVRNHTELDRAGRLLSLNSQRHLRPAKEIASLFRDVHGAIENSAELSSRLSFELSDLGYEFPRYPLPDGETMDSFLRRRVDEAIFESI